MKKILSIAILALMLVACSKNYGTKLEYGKGELYYTDKITEAEAKSLGKYLKDVQLFPEGKEVSYMIDKEGETYIFKLVIKDKKYLTEQSFIDDSQLTGAFISYEVFGEKPVDVWLCDDSFDMLKKIGFKSLPDSVKRKADEEKMINPPPSVPDGTPKDEVAPVDTSRGMPA